MEFKDSIREFYINNWNKYYIIEQQQYNIKKIFHRNITGSLYRAIVDKVLENEIIDFLSQFGEIQSVKEIQNQLIFSIAAQQGLIIFKLYSIDDLIVEVL